MITIRSPRGALLLLMFLQAAAGGPAEETLDFRRLAAERQPEARQAILAMPRDERPPVLRDLLRSRSSRVRLFAVDMCRSSFETRLANDVEAAAKGLRDEASRKRIRETADFLRAHRKIELPEAELAALFNNHTNGPSLKADWLGPVTLEVAVQNARGRPVAEARVLAYDRVHFIQAPAEGFTQTDKDGRVQLKLARGSWTIIALSPESYNQANEGRGVCVIARGRSLRQKTEKLTLRPNAEIEMRFGGEAEAVHAVDVARGLEVRFPSLGKGLRGAFVIETLAGEAPALAAFGKRDDKTRWIAFEDGLRAPARVEWACGAASQARVELLPPRLLPKLDAARISFRRFEHDATPLEFPAQPGQTVFAPPGRCEIEYSVDHNGRRFNYSPAVCELKAGQSRPLVLDSPSRATVYHEQWRQFYGKSKALTGGLLAWDGNGHFLSSFRKPGGLSLPAPIRVLRDGTQLPLDPTSEVTRLFRPFANDVESGWLSNLVYEIAADLGPGVPKRLRGATNTSFDSAHFTLEAPAPLRGRMELFGAGAERVYDAVLDMRGEKPGWNRTRLTVKTIMPPTVGAWATPQGIEFPVLSLLWSRWLDVETIGSLPHEMLHKFGLGHDDFMDVWTIETRRRIRQGCHREAASFPSSSVQRDILAFLRGDDVATPDPIVPWLIYARHGLKPFQGYQRVEKDWKTPLQADGLTDGETNCLILSEMAKADLRPIYAAAGIDIRPDAYAAARRKLPALRAKPAPAPQGPRITYLGSPVPPATNSAAATTRTPAERTASMLGRVLGFASAKKPGALEQLRKHIGLIRDLPVNRDRVRSYMRFGKAFYDLGAEQDACEAFRNAQREAAKAGRDYLDRCRHICTDGIMGKPMIMGHM